MRAISRNVRPAGPGPDATIRWRRRKRWREARRQSPLFAILLLDEFGAQVADPLHDAADRGAHFDLKQPVVVAPLVEQTLGDGEARLVPGQRDAKLGALKLDVGAQAQKAREKAAADRADD